MLRKLVMAMMAVAFATPGVFAQETEIEATGGSVSAEATGSSLSAEATGSSERPEIGSVAKVYKGPEGEQITVLRFGPKKNNKVLLKIAGIDHSWNGKIVVHKVKESQLKTEYVRQYKNKNYVTLYSKRDGYGGQNFYYMVPGLREEVYVNYDEYESKDVRPEHLLTEYLDQK